MNSLTYQSRLKKDLCRGSMIQISFRTQDPNIKTGTIRNPLCFQNPRIRAIFRTNPQSVRFLRPNPSIQKPIHLPPLPSLFLYALSLGVFNRNTYTQFATGLAHFEENWSVKLRKYFDWFVLQCETIWILFYFGVLLRNPPMSNQVKRTAWVVFLLHLSCISVDSWRICISWEPKHLFLFLFNTWRVHPRMKRKQIMKTTIIHDLCLFKALFLSISKPSPRELNHNIWNPR